MIEHLIINLLVILVPLIALQFVLFAKTPMSNGQNLYLCLISSMQVSFLYA